MRTTAHWIPAAILLGMCVTAAVLLASPDAYSQALDLLDEHDAVVRAAAVQYFESLGTSRLDDLLDELSQDHPPLTTAGLAEAVRGIGIGAGDANDVAVLLDSDAPPTRHAGVTILALQAASARSDLEAVATNPSELGAIRAAAASGLATAGAQARSTLRALIRDEDAPGVARKAALRSLALISSDGAEDVKTVAQDTDLAWPLRQAAIRALGQPTAPASGPLGHLLTSRESRVRAAVVEALVSRGGVQDLTLVASRLTDLAAEVRLAALRGLMLSGSAAANRQAVIGRMLDADPRVKALAADLVGQTCGDIASTVRPSLVSLLRSTNFRVRYKAALALFAHGDKFGAATMKTDSLSRNASQALQAGQAWRQITGQ